MEFEGCPPGQIEIHPYKSKSYTKCQKMDKEDSDRRRNFRKYLKETNLTNTFKKLTVEFIFAYSKNKTVDPSRFFADLLSASMGLGGKKYVDKTVDSYKKDIRTLQLELIEFENLIEKEKNLIEQQKQNPPDSEEIQSGLENNEEETEPDPGNILNDVPESDPTPPAPVVTDDTTEE